MLSEHRALRAAAVAVAGLMVHAALAAPAAGQAGRYAFVNVADDAGPYSSFNAPVISDTGVAFRAIRTGGGSGIFTGPDPVADAVATSSQSYSFFGDPTINAAGTVAFFALRDDNGEGIFTGPDPVADAVATSDGPYSSFGNPAINSAGTVAFLAVRDAGGLGVFTGPDPVADAVATDDGAYSLFGDPAINAAGTVAFFAVRDDNGEGIFTGPDPVADAVVTSDGPYSSFGDPAINDAGTVAFFAFRDAGGAGIFTGPDPVADAVATTDGPYSVFGSPAINAAGTVAFVATLDAGGRGIFTGPDPVADKVIATGDGLFGSSPTSLLAFGGSFLNDFGDVAFSYTLANGTQGVAVAVASSRFTATAGGSFTDPANFAFGLAPGDVVPTVITPANGLIVTGPSSNTTVRSLTLGTAGSGVAELRLQPGGQLTVNEGLAVRTQGKLRIDGAASVLGGVTNAGEIELVGGAQLNGGILINSGLLRGDGTVGNAVTNFDRIEAIGTAAAPKELTFTAAVDNGETGRITVRDAAVRFGGGLTNDGTLAFPLGVSDAFGDIDNAGTITVTGGANVTFHDDVVQNGTLRVSASGSTTSVLVFLGTFSGAGGTTGGGDLFFEGGVSIGNSPAEVTFDNDITLGSDSNTLLEIAGLMNGEFDRFVINGDLSLDGGSLSAVSFDGFAFEPNQSFEVFDVRDALTGTFAGLGEGGVVGNFNGFDLFITYAGGDGNDIVLSTVPEPSSLALLGLGGVALLRRRRA